MEDAGAGVALETLRARLLEIERLLSNCRALSQEKECIEKAIEGLERIGSDGEPLPVWQAARNILERKGKPMTVKQITDIILSTPGVQVEGKHRMESVRVALIRKPDVFEKLSTDGRYQLKK